MLKKLSIFLSTIAFLYASNVTTDIQKDKWNLVGIPTDTTLSALNIDSNDIAWFYKAGKWYSNQDTDGKYGALSSLKANSAVWIKPSGNKTLTFDTNDTYTFSTISKGWSMYSFAIDETLDTLDKSKTPLVWRYEDGWKLWDPYGLYKSEQTKISSLNADKGVWIYAYQSTIPDTIENIWNIKLPIKTSLSLSDFSISIQFVKPESDGTPDTGIFTYSGLSLQNGVINTPTSIYLQGNGDSGSQTNVYDKSYNPNNVLSNSIAYKDGNIILKLGTVVKLANPDDQDKFLTKAKYNLTIVSDKNIFTNDTNKTTMSIEIR